MYFHLLFFRDRFYVKNHASQYVIDYHIAAQEKKTKIEKLRKFPLLQNKCAKKRRVKEM